MNEVLIGNLLFFSVSVIFVCVGISKISEVKRLKESRDILKKQNNDYLNYAQGVRLSAQEVAREESDRVAKLFGLYLLTTTEPRPIITNTQLLLPEGMSAELQDTICYGVRNGREIRAAKVVFHEYLKSDLHHYFQNGKLKAVAIVGRDDTGNMYHHFALDEYLYKSLDDIENYFWGCTSKDDVMMA